MIKNPMPMHSGQVLAKVYMSEMGLNQSGLAGMCECSPRKINEIINEKRGIPASFSIVLESVLGTTAEMWIRTQAEYDLFEARRKDA